MFPLGPDPTPWRKLDDRRASRRRLRRPQRAAHRARGADRAGVPGVPRRLPPAAAGPSPAAPRHPRRPGGLGERPVRGARPAEERQHRRRRRAADVPGHRHRHRVRQEGPARLGRGRRGGGDRLGRPPHLHRDQSALFADGAALDVRGGQHRQQPARAVRHHRRARRGPCRRVLPHVRRQGRRLGEQELPVPGDPRGAARPSAC